MVFKWFFKSHPFKSHPFKSHPLKSHPLKSHPHGTTTNSNNLGPIWETLLCMNPKPSAPQSSCHDYIPFAYERFWSPWPMTRMLLVVVPWGCDFMGCDFKGCDFKGCDFKGCDLKGCDFKGCDLNPKPSARMNPKPSAHHEKPYSAWALNPGPNMRNLIVHEP